MNQCNANVLPRGATMDVDNAADRVDASGSSPCADDGHVRGGHRLCGHFAADATVEPDGVSQYRQPALNGVCRVGSVDGGCGGTGRCPTPHGLDSLRRGRCPMQMLLVIVIAVAVHIPLFDPMPMISTTPRTSR